MADQSSNSPATLQPLSKQLDLNAHEAAPPELKSFFKFYSKPFEGEQESLIDLGKIRLPGLTSIPPERAKKAFETLLKPKISRLPPAKMPAMFRIVSHRDISSERNELDEPWGEAPEDVSSDSSYSAESDEEDSAEDDGAEDYPAFTFKQIPGLVFLPRLLPREIQTQLLDRLLHRELFNPAHRTNLHAHYDMIYPDGQNSFFTTDPSLVLQPKDPTIHPALKMESALARKLRWMTLGGQYDWTNKIYPAEPPPQFPKDIASFIHHLFPDMEPQAAIVNVYSPGDKLSMHRDVSEEVDQGLVSISLGCSCIFVIGLEDQATRKIQKLAIRLRSGDALYMTGESRLAWHGVPRIEKNTCPRFLQNWPGGSFQYYLNWMEDKRINLNVRQMRKATMEESGYSTTRIDDPDYEDFPSPLSQS